MPKFNRFALSVVALLVCCTIVVAANTKLKLKDGTVLEGEVRRLGSSYTIKLPNGSLRLIAAKDVEEAEIDGGGDIGGDKPANGVANGPKAPAPAAELAQFNKVARAADRCDTPELAVGLWQQFIDDNPEGAKLAEAKTQLETWKERAKSGAERVKGRWVTGAEIKKLKKEVAALLKEAEDDLANNQTTRGVGKLEEVLKIYPNSFDANFDMGFFYLVKGTATEDRTQAKLNINKATDALLQATKLRPNSAAAHSNLAIAYNLNGKWEQSILSAFKAAQIEDTKDIVQNLINAIEFTPPTLKRNNRRIQPAIDELPLLASKYGLSGGQQWSYVRPTPAEKEGKDEEGMQGVVGSGTGFFITDTGYILTNRHVASAGDHLIVFMSDGTQKIADKVYIDDKQDIAILKIKSDKPLSFVHIAPYDQPPVGSDVTVMGFPLGASLGQHVKITRGVVTSVESDKPDCDVIVDAQVNPGNSGGPMIDKYGNLLALVAMKTLAVDESISSYGLGISPGRLRKFFEQQKETLGVELAPAEKTPDKTLTTEDIAGQYTPATVMILMVNGELPEGMGSSPAKE